ncbi:MAG: 4Fe-4S dicluster domain-containing protein [Bacillota bacterium]
MLRKTGVPSEEELAKVIPPGERLERGAVAIIECFERIPCNPCHDACARGAIKPFKDINDLPELDLDKCNGCGLCVAACPGLAIFVVDMSFSPDEALVKLPYEFLPLPEQGQMVSVLDREGNSLGQGRVVRVQRGKLRTATPVVWVAVPKSIALDVRHIVVPEL